MESNKQIAVIGGGSWATAIIKLLLNNVDKVNWYIRNPRQIEFIKKHHHNPRYLSSIEVNVNKIGFYNSINETIENSHYLIIAIPAPFIEKSFINCTPLLENKFVISAVKGIIPGHNLTLAEYFNTIHKVPFSSLGTISGPCHAEEIALERLSYLTVSAKSTVDANHIADAINSYYLKAKTSKDIYGTEYAAVLKNIIAIAAGISHGLGYGDNFLAVLISNGHQEIKRFLDKTYKSKRKINSSPYLGDLLVTCYSQFSRNRTFGKMIGKGYSVKSAQLEMNMIAEGYYAVACIKEINKNFKVKLPIVDAVYNVLYEKITPVIEMKLLTEKLK